MSKKAYQFYNDVYFQAFYFLPNWTREDMIKVFHQDVDSDAQGMTFNRPEGIFIWIREFNNENLGYLTHESVHGANFLFALKGQKISVKNDEAQAYLVQWIFDNCRKYLRKKRK